MGFRDSLPKISNNTANLALVSFFMNFSTSIVMSNAISSINHNDGTGLYLFTITKILGDCLGYFGKVVIGFQSDITQQRRKFLIYGYGAVLFVKPLFALSCYSFFAGSTQLILFGIANVLDKFFNSLRDIPRDALIADSSDTNDLRNNFTFRRAFAFLGTLLGGLFTFLYLKKFQNILYLYIFAVIPAIISVIILVLRIFDKPRVKVEKKVYFLDLVKNVFIFNSQRDFLLLCFLLLFLMLSLRANETMIFEKAIKYGLTAKKGGLCFSIFYFMCFCNSLLVSWLKKFPTFYLLIFVMFGLILSNILLIKKLNIFVLLFSTFFYAFNIGIIESLITSLVLKKYKTIWKGFLISVVNTFIAVSLFCNTLWLRFSLNTFHSNTVFTIAIVPAFLSIFFLIFLKRKFQVQNN